MIDSHAHLADASFAEDLDSVIERAELAGVQHIVCVSEGLVDGERVLRLANTYPQVLPCVGLHPDAADMNTARKVCDLIEQQAEHLIGIGEVGLDYWIAKEPSEREQQREVLALFVRLSNTLDLPVNVHSRSAGHYAIDFLCQQGASRVLMHAFDGKASRALVGIEAGYVFSIPPSIVRSVQKQKLVKRLPLT